MITDLRFIKAAYGFENHHRCAFSEKVQKSFYEIQNYLNPRSGEKLDTTWIAIYIPTTTTKWRRERNLPDIQKFHGHIAAFQEILNTPGIRYRDYGYDAQWPVGINARKIFRFQEPCCNLKTILDESTYQSFKGKSHQSAAMRLDEASIDAITKIVESSKLIEVPFTKLER